MKHRAPGYASIIYDVNNPSPLAGKYVKVLASLPNNVYRVEVKPGETWIVKGEIVNPVT